MGSPGGFPGRFDGTMAGDACIGEECATDGVGVLALMKVAFIATSEGTVTHIASYVEAGTLLALVVAFWRLVWLRRWLGILGREPQ